MSTETTLPRLRRKEASDYLLSRHGVHRAPATLSKLAWAGGGPKFVRFGRVPLYAPADLDAWVAAHITGPVRNTSEVAA